MEVNEQLLLAMGFKKETWHEERERCKYVYPYPGDLYPYPLDVVIWDEELEEGDYESPKEVVEYLISKVKESHLSTIRRRVLEVLNA